MRKKFVSAMAFGAMILASSPVLVSCSDYDDDIDRLQNQVDGIKGENPVTPAELQAALDAAKADYQAALELALTGKADNAAVQALQAKVNELNDALNGKADAATVQGILNDIRTLSEEVNSVKDGLDGVKSELQGEIDALKEKIAGVESGAATKAELKAQLDAAVAELNAKIAAADNTADIEALNGKLTELKNAQDALSGKLDADKTELTGKIADALAKAEDAAAKAGDAATKAEVEALKSKVDALEGTVASNEALNTIKSELEGKIAEAMAKAQEAAAAAGNAASAAAFEELKGTVTTLSGKIDELTSKPSLTEADVRSLIQAELTSSLTDLNNKMIQVENSISNNARAITELTQKIAKIAEIESTLTDYESRLALVESGKASKQDLTDLATRVGTLETSMQGLSETIGSYLTANSYAKLSDIDSKLSTQLASYYTKGEVDQAIQNKINAAKQLTEAQQKAVQEVFANLDTEAEGFKTYAELLGEVATLNAKFAEDGDVAALETGLSDLDKKFNEFVNSANAAIQSIVFMPENMYRTVSFRSLILTASNKYVPITSTKEQTIRFRVTPAAAAKNLAENYDLKFLGHKQTRAIGGNKYIEQVDGTNIDVAEDGVVSIRVKTGTDNTLLDRDVQNHYSSICLQATAKEKKDSEGKKIEGVMRADLTSDYFTLAVTKREVSKVYVFAANEPDPTIGYVNNWSFDYKSGRMFTDQSGNRLDDLNRDGFDMEKVGKVKYELVRVIPQFTIDEDTGVLTYVKVNEPASIGAQVQVKAIYTFNNDEVSAQISKFPTTYKIITVTKEISNNPYEVEAERFGNIEWTTGRTYPLDMLEVQNRAGMSSKDFTALLAKSYTEEVAVNGDKELRIDQDPLTGNLVVVVPPYINMAKATYRSTILNDDGTISYSKALRRKYVIDDLHTFEIIVHLPETSVFPGVEITRNEYIWSGDQLFVPASEDKNSAGKINGVRLTDLDYSAAYDNYKPDYVNVLAAKGLNYSLAVTPAKINNISVQGVLISNGKVSVNKDEFNGGKACKVADIKASIKLNQNRQTDEMAVNNGSIIVDDLSGLWEVTKKAFTVNSFSDKIQLAEGCTWFSRGIKENGKIVRHIMWKAGKLYDASVEGSKFANNPLDMYGLTAPKFTKITDPNNLANVNPVTGELTFKDNAKDFLLQKDYTITVESVIKSRWGEYSEPRVDLYTITIPKGTK